MKIAMINTELTRGGAARMAATLAQSLYYKFQDIDITLYHCENSHKDLPPFMGLKRFFSRQVNALLARIGGSGLVLDGGVSSKLLQLTKSADILHIHNIHGYYLNYINLIESWADRPIVWTWHDMWGATGRCGFSMNCDKWQTGCLSCQNKNFYPKAWIDRARAEYKAKNNLYKKLKDLHIVSPSKWLAEIAIKRGFSDKKIHVIPNAIDIEKFNKMKKEEARGRLGLPEKKFLALFIASDCDDPRKGFSDFVHAVKHNECIGVAVGKQSRKCSKNIKQIGLAPESKINLFYSAADVMLIPSYADNYPNTVIEALACGTPVIGYNEGGISSQLDFPFCKIIPKGDLDSLTTTLCSFVDSGGKTPEMAKELSSLAKIRWNTNSISEKYHMLYYRIIKNYPNIF